MVTLAVAAVVLAQGTEVLAAAVAVRIQMGHLAVEETEALAVAVAEVTALAWQEALPGKVVAAQVLMGAVVRPWVVQCSCAMAVVLQLLIPTFPVPTA